MRPCLRTLPFLLALLLAGCAPSRTLDNWLLAADAVSPEEATESFLEELEDRLDAADQDLRDDQADALEPILTETTVERRRILERYRGAGPQGERAAHAEVTALQARMDARVEMVLDPPQVPVYRALMAEVTAWFTRELQRPG